MLKLVKFDLINRFKKPITWFVIIVLCVTMGINFLEIEEARTTRPFAGHNPARFSNNYLKWEAFMTSEESAAHPQAYKSHLLIDETVLDANKAIVENDYVEISRLSSFFNLLLLKWTRVSLDPISDIMLKNKIHDIWVEVADDIPYESVDFRPFTTGGGSDSENSFLLRAKYYENLYLNNLEPVYNDEVNNLNTIYSYLLKILPLMIFLVVILFTFNNINKEKNSGMLKLVLTQSISRVKYYFSKWLSSVLYILTIIFIPPILMSIVGGFIGGFSSFKYPVFYLSNALTRLAPIPNYFDSVSKDFTDPTLLSRVFGHVAPSSHNNVILPGNHIDIIPFYKYIILVMLLIILFVMFLVAFVQLISAIVNHEIISLVTSSGLIAIFIFIGQLFTQEASHNLNPFTFSNASRIVEGTMNVTFLTSTLVMLVSTAILLAVGFRCFRKKEI